MSPSGRRARQRGLSMIGFLFVTSVVLVVALIGFRVIPAYIEYFSVQKALQGAMSDSTDLTVADIRKLVDRRIDADYIDSVRAADVAGDQGRQRDHGIVPWQTKLHLVGNASLLLDFDASASRLEAQARTGGAARPDRQPSDRLSIPAPAARLRTSASPTLLPPGADASQLRHSRTTSAWSSSATPC